MKVGGKRKRRRRRMRAWKVERQSQVHAFLMGRLPSARDREKRGSTGEKERGGTDCLLIRPDNCRWVRGSPCLASPRLASPPLAANHLDLTFPPTSLPLPSTFRSFTALGVPFLSDSDMFLSRVFFLSFSSSSSLLFCSLLSSSN